MSDICAMASPSASLSCATLAFSVAGSASSLDSRADSARCFSILARIDVALPLWSTCGMCTRSAYSRSCPLALDDMVGTWH